MTTHFFTRLAAYALLPICVLLSSCGASSIKDPFVPTRVVVFGDSLSVISTTAAFTVNDASVNNWARQIATSYGVTTIVSNAVANATVAGVAAQVTAFGANFQDGDLVVISAGFRDIINDAQAATNTSAASGVAYANVIRTLVANGAKHVAVTNVYALEGTPAAAILTNLSASVTLPSGQPGTRTRAFNDALKSNLGSTVLSYIGDNVRLVDAELYLNLVRTVPATYSYVDATTVVCGVGATDAGAGIGIGANQVNSSLCTAATINPLATSVAYTTPAYNNYVFADAIYPTPTFHRGFGAYVHSQLVTRW
jgi:outer membrane lipase/esterase